MGDRPRDLLDEIVTTSRDAFMSQYQNLFLVRPRDLSNRSLTQTRPMRTVPGFSADVTQPIRVSPERGAAVALALPDIGVLHSVRLGRAVDNDLVVADVTVSKVHARIDAGVDGLWVCDLGSRNGSKLRGQALTVDVPRSFVVGDELGFGSTRFIVVDAAACWALIRQQLEV